MAITAITRCLNDEAVVPKTAEDWRDWVSATDIRNHFACNTLIDWLDLYGAARGFTKDTALPNYDPRTEFTTFLFK